MVISARSRISMKRYTVHFNRSWYLMRKLPPDLIRHALEEDGADADITTLTTVPADQRAHASIIARQAGVIAGLAVVAETFRLLDAQVAIELLVEDGAAVQPGQMLA